MAKLKFVHAVMRAGKSTDLLQVHYNYRTYGKRVLVYTSALDDRNGVGYVTSAIGGSIEAKAVSSQENIYCDVANEHAASPVDCVLVDEAQFFSSDQIMQLSDVVDDLGVDVVCYGLKSDVFGNLFAGSETLLSMADNIEEIRQMCFCGRKATMNLRFDNEGYVQRHGQVVDIGDIGKYLPVCRQHFKHLRHRSEVPMNPVDSQQKAS